MLSHILPILLTRALLVVLFMPFSALDKILDFKGAVGQAKELVASDLAATLLILAGLATEVIMPVCILTGVADRAAALVMAGYCMVTAFLWKQFWRPGDFWHPGASAGRSLFWDFLKNFSLAGGFLLIVLLPAGLGVAALVADPLGSTHPYATPAAP